ncbi:ferric reductase like transmembrane component-domain-containing protein [Zopfochytrium polystomum]|nr:ferric reductase like transmembrane component-domain-containing protein [Zopfochytrium polystomum]
MSSAAPSDRPSPPSPLPRDSSATALSSSSAATFPPADHRASFRSSLASDAGGRGSPSRRRAALARTLIPLSATVLLGLSACVFPASWVFAHFYAGNKAGCFSDVCDHTSPTKAAPIRKNLALFYSFLALTAALALAAKVLRPVRRVFAFAPFKSSVVTVGEVGWFALAVFVACFASPATNWMAYYSMKNGQVASGNWQWIHAIFEVLTWLAGDSASIIYGLVLLPASKYSAVNDALGLPYSSTVRVHQWLGYATFWTVMAHFATGLLDEQWGASAFFTLLFVPRQDRTGASPWGNRNYLFVFGAWATIALCIVVATALPFVRRRAYNVFYVSHMLVIAFILFAYFHASMSIFFAIPGLVLWGIDGCLRFASRFKANTIVEYTTEECGYRTITVKTHRGTTCRPGQFMRVAVPAVSAFEYHPWSVLRATDTTVTFLFAPASSKPAQWTSKVVKYLDESASDLNAPGAKPPKVRLQGPFGRAAGIAADFDAYHSIVLYVGGTGVAPALAILDHILRTRESSSSSSSSSVAAAAADLVTSDTKSETPLLREVAASDVALTLHLYDTSRPGFDVEAAAGAGGEVKLLDGGVAIHATRARPHLRALLNKHVLAKVVAAQEAGGTARVGVFMCGPESFMADGLASVAAFKSHNEKVVVDTEVESYAL